MGVPNERLRRLRLERGLTLEQAAKRVGISRQYMGMLEAGERVGTLRVWRKIAELYGVTVDSLLFSPGGYETLPDDEAQQVKPSA